MTTNDDTTHSTLPVTPRPESRDAPRRTVFVFDTRSFTRIGLITMGLVVALLLGLWLFEVMRHFLFLLLLAWMFAMALEPGIKRLEARGRGRGLAAAIGGGGAVIVVIVLTVMFGGLFFTSASGFVDSAPAFATHAITRVNSTFGTAIDATNLTDAHNLSKDQLGTIATSLGGGVLGVVGSLAAVLFDLVTVLVFGFYFAADGPGFIRAVSSWLPSRGQRVFVGISASRHLGI